MNEIHIEQAKQGSRLISIVIIGVLILIVIASFFYFLLLPKFGDESASVQTRSVQLTGIEVAEGIASFLDTTRKNGGEFGLMYTCREGVCVEEERQGPQSVGQIIIGYRDLYGRTSKSEYKDTADAASNRILNLCRDSVTQCKRNFFSLLVSYRYTWDQRYYEGLIKTKDFFLSETYHDAIKEQSGIKLLMLNEIDPDQKLIDKLVEFADQALLNSRYDLRRIHNINGFSINRDDFQIMWSLMIPAYTATNDEKYLKVVKDFVSGLDVMQNKDLLAEQVNIFDLLKSVEVLLSLSSFSSDPIESASYKEQARLIMDGLLNDRYDGPERPLSNGQGGFVSRRQNNHDAIYRKDSLANGWLVQLYLKFPNEPFSLKVPVK